MSTLNQQAIELIWREAALLDALDYDPWLDMWTQDGLYIIPIEPDAEDYTSTLNIAHDDATMRAARVKRLTSGFSSSSAPPARTVRSVSRFVFEETEQANVLRVHAGQILTEYKYERFRVRPANMTYDILCGDDGMKLHRKVVKLTNADDAQHGIGYLL